MSKRTDWTIKQAAMWVATHNETGETLVARSREAQRKQAMQTTLTMKIERTETGEFIAYFSGDYHIGYGATASDAREALLWSMENE